MLRDSRNGTSSGGDCRNVSSALEEGSLPLVSFPSSSGEGVEGGQEGRGWVAKHTPTGKASRSLPFRL